MPRKNNANAKECQVRIVMCGQGLYFHATSFIGKQNSSSQTKLF